MRLCRAVLFAIGCFALDALHAADLKPGGVVESQFPELPPTPQAMVKDGNKAFFNTTAPRATPSCASLGTILPQH
jgi:hypothetical protein